MNSLLFTLINCVVTVTLASFVTLCGQRQVTHQLPWQPQFSICDNCSHRLCWWQLIPVIGFIVQRGKCHWCGARISSFFPLSETVVILFTAKTFSFSWQHNLILTCALLTLLYLSITDFTAQVIYPLALTGLLPLLFILSPSHFLTSQALIEIVLIGTFLFILQFLTKGLGTGDIYFILMTDFIWHWEATAQIVLIGCILTIIPTIIKRGKKLPLIPGLAISFIVRLLFYLS
jgi:prepilin signal peptidase PulO-like enzyme (type II secretory pathway)